MCVNSLSCCLVLQYYCMNVVKPLSVLGLTIFRGMLSTAVNGKPYEHYEIWVLARRMWMLLVWWRVLCKWLRVIWRNTFLQYYMSSHASKTVVLILLWEVKISSLYIYWPKFWMHLLFFHCTLVPYPQNGKVFIIRGQSTILLFNTYLCSCYKAIKFKLDSVAGTVCKLGAWQVNSGEQKCVFGGGGMVT